MAPKSVVTRSAFIVDPFSYVLTYTAFLVREPGKTFLTTDPI
jgi:hypothetical protein